MKSHWLILLFFFFSSNLLAQGQLHYKIESLLTDSLSKASLQKELKYFNAIDSLYKSRTYKELFDKSMANSLVNYLAETEAWGLNLEKYHFELLVSLNESRIAADKAYFQVLACEAYLLLYTDIENGLLTTEAQRGKNIHFDLYSLNPDLELSKLAQVSSLVYLNLLQENVPAYNEFKTMLSHYYFDQELYDAKKLIFIDSLSLGKRDSLVLDLKKRLLFLGDLKSPKHLRSMIFDQNLVKALSNFQKRNLLDVNGILDAKTLSVLNRPLIEIIEEMQINLERWRWMPSYLGDFVAFANLAAFEMSLIKDDSLLLRQNVVCGKVGRNTPVFMDTMVYIDLNPTWTVPPTILQNDILPAAKRSSTYLSKTNIKVLDTSTGKYIASSQINWARASSYKYIQGPGLSNSLGVVKFIFPNDYYIFFHDTPHKEHFPLKVRAYSSGCVRLSQPILLAEILLSYNEKPVSKAGIDSIFVSQKTTRILLDQQPKVYIQYITQELKDGLLYQYPDTYKYNADLQKQFFAWRKD